jgi:hypothetical protein
MVVMPALVAGIHVLLAAIAQAWMAGTFLVRGFAAARRCPAMTQVVSAARVLVFAIHNGPEAWEPVPPEE